HQTTPQCLGLPPTGPGNHPANGPEADHALTLKPDHSGGAGQVLDAFERLGVPVPEADETSIFEDMEIRATKNGETPQEFQYQRYEYYRSLQKI
ncbi:hypothetical protein, partial [Maritimibacter sp. 55A14]|uniref:hypothetical protein n=1 Tax=Maritimibacter sp. 55A14 TaxID=2174844 RepID=UPI001E5C142E